ncbi:bifunctional oligoribonuclease/PAP phosphatase NrnA [Bacteroidota bacterium]
MLSFREFREILNTPSRKIVITTHHKPDADGLGSSLGLMGYLCKKGHECTVISPTDYPDFLSWMKGNESVVIYENGEEERAKAIIDEADVIFCLDFNSLKRIDGLGDYLEKSSALKVLIDHHLEPEKFADFEFYDVEAAATAELVYELIVKMDDRNLIDRDIAESLYAGIMTDTGQFKHNNTTQNVHYVTASLMELGADTSKVGTLIYDTNSFDRLKFIGFALSQRLKFLPEYHTAYFVISADDLNRFNSKTGDTEGLVNYALSLDDAVMGALIMERDGQVRISLRSKGDFSVNEFARKHFDGGGHMNAAGGNSYVSLEETVEKFEHILKDYKEELDNSKKNYEVV